MITLTKEEALTSPLNQLQTLIAHASNLPHPARAAALVLAEFYDADIGSTFIYLDELARYLGVRESVANECLTVLLKGDEWSANEERNVLTPNLKIMKAQLEARLDYLSLLDTFSPEFDDDPWNDKDWTEGY